ncbi:MAG TPA: exonuclease domain-containing protein, partial [Candidatus Omnitrophota bacterium]|nr:exonuclease domain-containing protein [Candidatus Omnitrophota bacterium]
MNLSEATYTVFDFETTGLFAGSGDAICEIGAMRREPDGKESVFEELVDPLRPVSPGAYRVN